MTASRKTSKKIARQRSFSLPDSPESKKEKKWQQGKVPVDIPALPILDRVNDHNSFFSPRSISSRSASSNAVSARTDSPRANGDSYYSPRQESPRAKTARLPDTRSLGVELTSPRIKSARVSSTQNKIRLQCDSGEQNRSARSSSPRFLRLFSSKKSSSHSRKADSLFFANNLPLNTDVLERLYAHLACSIADKKMSPGGSCIFTTWDEKIFELFYLGVGVDGLNDIVAVDFSDILGYGANSVVFKAYNIRSGEHLAAKAYATHFVDALCDKEGRLLSACGYLGTQMVSRWVSEKRATKILSRQFSGNITLMHALGDFDLRDLLYHRHGSKRKISPLKKLYLVDAVLRAVYELHRRGVMHSDIKLDAFRITQHGDEFEAFLIDLGSASFLTEKPYSVYRSSFGYAPPEVCVFESGSDIRRSYTRVSDYYMAGVVLLELINRKDYQAYLLAQLNKRKKQKEMSDLDPSEIRGFFKFNLMSGQKSNLNKRLSKSNSLEEYVAIYLDLPAHFNSLVSGLLHANPLSRPDEEGFVELIRENQQVIEKFLVTQQRFGTFFDVMAELNEAGVESEMSFSKFSI